jgi:hypothetical protein
MTQSVHGGYHLRRARREIRREWEPRGVGGQGGQRVNFGLHKPYFPRQIKSPSKVTLARASAKDVDSGELAGEIPANTMTTTHTSMPGNVDLSHVCGRDEEASRGCLFSGIQFFGCCFRTVDVL